MAYQPSWVIKGLGYHYRMTSVVLLHPELRKSILFPKSTGPKVNVTALLEFEYIYICKISRRAQTSG